jgi:hypothetical protein
MKWKDINHWEPQHKEIVLGYFPEGNEGGEKVSMARWTGKKLISNFPNSTAHCFEASHWMELPKPPNT